MCSNQKSCKVFIVGWKPEIMDAIYVCSLVGLFKWMGMFAYVSIAMRTTTSS
jgi:hypothetical protein